MNPLASIEIAGETIELRMMGPRDEPAMILFARSLAVQDLLFLPRDIREPKVVTAWLGEAKNGNLKTILAWRGSTVVGCGTVARDPLSWSAHVAEIRSVISPELRGRGLGAHLVQGTFRLALLGDPEKIFAQMTTDQAGAIATFQGLGFTTEAMLRDQVMDSDGVTHDLLILAHHVAEVAARSEASRLSEF